MGLAIRNKGLKVILSLYILLSAIFTIDIVSAQAAPVTLFDDGVSKSPEMDEKKIGEFRLRCEYYKTLIVKDKFPLDCFSNYQHYGAKKIVAQKKAFVKIANYNLLHPGTSKSLFKDNEMVAKIMNNYDIISGLELLNTVGRDEQVNKMVINYLHDTPATIKKLIESKQTIKDANKLKEIDERVKKLTETTNGAYDLLRAPGYLKILDELKKLDSSWSLILSPRGDSALVGSVEELVGFYYRASAVKPALNPHCQEFLPAGGGNPIACFIDLSAKFMNKDLIHHFARRPFMASFQINNSIVHLVTNHTVFTYSGSEEAEAKLMNDTFGVNSYKELGAGINGSNFARFAEIKNTLDFMYRFKYRYQSEKIMYMGDMNINSSNVYWPQILKAFPGSELLIKEATTLSPQRFSSNGNPTNGVANDYDHFIINRNTFSNCSTGEVMNYYNSPIYTTVKSRYIIRDEASLKLRTFGESFGSYEFAINSDHTMLEGDLPPIDDPTTIQFDYPLTPGNQSKMDKKVSVFEAELKKFLTIKKDEIVFDDYLFNERVDGYRRRVFLRQLTNAYYFRFMQEVLSDHFPIAITCKF